MTRLVLSLLFLAVLFAFLGSAGSAQTPPADLGSLLSAEQKARLDISKLTAVERSVIVEVITLGLKVGQTSGYKTGIVDGYKRGMDDSAAITKTLFDDYYIVKKSDLDAEIKPSRLARISAALKVFSESMQASQARTQSAWMAERRIDTNCRTSNYGAMGSSTDCNSTVR